MNLNATRDMPPTALLCECCLSNAMSCSSPRTCTLSVRFLYLPLFPLWLAATHSTMNAASARPSEIKHTGLHTRGPHASRLPLFLILAESTDKMIDQAAAGVLFLMNDLVHMGGQYNINTFFTTQSGLPKPGDLETGHCFS